MRLLLPGCLIIIAACAGETGLTEAHDSEADASGADVSRPDASCMAVSGSVIGLAQFWFVIGVIA